jgi:hypothetical protein
MSAISKTAVITVAVIAVFGAILRPNIALAASAGMCSYDIHDCYTVTQYIYLHHVSRIGRQPLLLRFIVQ